MSETTSLVATVHHPLVHQLYKVKTFIPRLLLWHVVYKICICVGVRAVCTSTLQYAFLTQLILYNVYTYLKDSDIHITSLCSMSCIAF